MKPRSLLSRLLLRLALATGATVVIAVGLLLWQFERATGDLVGSDLPKILEAVVKEIRIDAAGRPELVLPADFPFAFDDERFVILADREGVAYASVPRGHAHVYHPFSHDQTLQPQFFEHRYIDSPMTYLGVTQQVTRDGTEFWVQVVDEVSYFETLAYYSISLFGEGLGVLIVVHLLIVAALCYNAVRSTLSPIRRAAAEAKMIDPGSGDRRIGVESLPQEVRPLADAANHALDRLQTALAAQRQFTADAAHEILTPLAVVRAEAESLAGEKKSAMLSEIDELADMAMQLLELAELDAMETLPDDPVDLGAVAEEVIARFGRQIIERGIEPRLVAPEVPVVVRGCPKGIRSALTNLIKNVLQHAEGARNLEVRIEAPGRIVVADDGPGIAAADRDTIFDRFHRASPERPGNRGLGLAIVKRVLDRHHGTVAVSDGPGGRGIAFVLDLPVSRDAAGMAAE